MARKKGNGLEQALIMDKFSEHTKAIGGLTQAVSDLRVDVAKIKTAAELSAANVSKKESFKTKVFSILFSGAIAALIAFLL